MLRNFVSAAFAVLVIATSAHTAAIDGLAGDAKTSMAYDSATGELRIQPDGHQVGRYQILSDSGIYGATATLEPPGGAGLDVQRDLAIPRIVGRLPHAYLACR